MSSLGSTIKGGLLSKPFTFKNTELSKNTATCILSIAQNHDLALSFIDYDKINYVTIHLIYDSQSKELSINPCTSINTLIQTCSKFFDIPTDVKVYLTCKSLLIAPFKLVPGTLIGDYFSDVPIISADTELYKVLHSQKAVMHIGTETAISIPIKTSPSRTTKIRIFPSDTIKILKLRIEESDGIEPEKLAFKGKILPDDIAIEDIQGLLVKLGDSFKKIDKINEITVSSWKRNFASKQIHINFMAGKKLTIHLDSNEIVVGNLKEKISKLTDISVHNFKLVYKTKHLYDTDKIKFSNNNDKSTDDNFYLILGNRDLNFKQAILPSKTSKEFLVLKIKSLNHFNQPDHFDLEVLSHTITLEQFQKLLNSKYGISPLLQKFEIWTLPNQEHTRTHEDEWWFGSVYNYFVGTENEEIKNVEVEISEEKSFNSQNFLVKDIFEKYLYTTFQSNIPLGEEKQRKRRKRENKRISGKEIKNDTFKVLNLYVGSKEVIDILVIYKEKSIKIRISPGIKMSDLILNCFCKEFKLFKQQIRFGKLTIYVPNSDEQLAEFTDLKSIWNVTFESLLPTTTTDTNFSLMLEVTENVQLCLPLPFLPLYFPADVTLAEMKTYINRKFGIEQIIQKYVLQSGEIQDNTDDRAIPAGTLLHLEITKKKFLNIYLNFLKKKLTAQTPTKRTELIREHVLGFSSLFNAQFCRYYATDNNWVEYRSEFPYFKPQGWMRYSLKIYNFVEYGHWPIAYLGNALDTTDMILRYGLKVAGKTIGEMIKSEGRVVDEYTNIVLTPSSDLASLQSKWTKIDGKWYVVVFQVKVRPGYFIVKDVEDVEEFGWVKGVDGLDNNYDDGGWKGGRWEVRNWDDVVVYGIMVREMDCSEWKYRERQILDWEEKKLSFFKV